VVDAAHAGNVYVNRNMVGAVVGVQPFGGEGLSGTGPKAGGPLYLYRLLAARPEDVLPVHCTAPMASTKHPLHRAALRALMDWAASAGRQARLCGRTHGCAWRSGASVVLPGPTGERNVYSIAPRSSVLCLANDDADRLVQLAAVLAVGSRAIWPADAQGTAAACCPPKCRRTWPSPTTGRPTPWCSTPRCTMATRKPCRA
jgi:RHH-type proline utilization regulon transcriptional repressor/proline dehydrogenase/delta 1-pyrroline-5-carboxylate dehydrogenase